MSATDTHQLLHASSFHPTHTTRGILKSQLLRFKRISHCYSDYSSACRILFEVLKNRGYSRTHFRIMKYHVWYNQSALKRDEETERVKIMPIVNYYDKISSRITQIIITRIIAAFKKHRSLQNILCHSRFTTREDWIGQCRTPCLISLLSTLTGIYPNGSGPGQWSVARAYSLFVPNRNPNPSPVTAAYRLYTGVGSGPSAR